MASLLPAAAGSRIVKADPVPRPELAAEMAPPWASNDCFGDAESDAAGSVLAVAGGVDPVEPVEGGSTVLTAFAGVGDAVLDPLVCVIA